MTLLLSLPGDAIMIVCLVLVALAFLFLAKFFLKQRSRQKHDESTSKTEDEEFV